MHFCILNTGSRLASSKISEVNGEALIIADILVEAGHEITMISKLSDRDVLDSRFNWFDPVANRDALPKGIDACIWLNGKANFFGGGDNPAEVMNYSVAKRLRTPIYYVMTDAILPFLDIIPNVASREWASNYNLDDLLIDASKVTLICQSANTNRMLEWHNSFAKDCYQLTKAIHVPLQNLFAFTSNRWGQVCTEKQYDVIYGGGKRRGNRTKLIENFFIKAPMSSYVFGNLKLSDFSKSAQSSTTVFGTKVDWMNFIPEMSKGFATCFIGDEIFSELAHITLRPLESMIAECVTFCHSSQDPLNSLYSKNSWLRIESNYEFFEKVKAAKSDVKLLKKIKDEQLFMLENQVNTNTVDLFLKSIM